MGSTLSRSCLNMFRPKKLRYHCISDSYDSQTQPLLHNYDQNQFMKSELEHDVQAFWEKISAVEKEIGALKSNLSRPETKLQTKAKEGNNQQRAITSLEQKVDKLKKNLDGIFSGNEAKKKMNSDEITKQEGAIIEIEENSSDLEKKVAELEMRVTEVTPSLIDMMAVISELQDKYSSNPQEALAKVPDMILVSEGDLVTVCFLILVFIVTFIIGKNL